MKEQERAFKAYIAQTREEIRDIEETSAGTCVLLGGNEDCSMGGSISESSERLLQRSSGEKSRYKILVKGEFNAIKCLLYKRFSASHEELMSP